MAYEGIVPAKSISLSDQQLDALERESCEVITDLEGSHDTYLKAVREWWSWYEGTPVSRERSWPWQGSSNLVIPIIRQAADNIVARYFNQIHATGKVWAGTSTNDEFKEAYLPGLVEFANAAEKRHIHLASVTPDWLQELVVIGESILALSWKVRSTSILDPRSGELRQVSLGAGPCVEHIPREDILWYRNVPIHLSECVVRESLFTAGEVRRLCRAFGISEDVADKILKHPEDGTSASSGVRDGKKRAESSPRGGTDSVWGQFSVRECYMTLPMLKQMGVDISYDPKMAKLSLAEPKVVVTLHPASKTILRVTPYPYYQENWLFFQGYLRKRSGRSSGAGLAKMLEHHQRGISTMMNQSVDAVTRANAIWGKTTSPQVASMVFSPNKLIQVNEMGDLELMPSIKNVMPDIAIMGSLRESAERISGVNDPLLGRDTAMGGHPTPATSTLALLGESNKLFAMGLTILRDALSRMGESTLQLYQQFKVDPAVVEQMVGKQDAAQVMEWLAPTGEPVMGTIQMDLHAVSETMNPDAERQKAVLVNEMVANTYARMLQLTQILDSPQVGPLTKQKAQEAMVAATEGLKDFLEAAEIDDIEKYVTAMRGVQQNALSRLDQPQPQQQLPGGPGGGQPPPAGGMAGLPAPPGGGGLGAILGMAGGGEGGANGSTYQ